MEVRQLQIFCILAEELRFTRAAERAHTVQSNVTAQIKTLEIELGVRLFDRLGHRIVLTEAGRRFRQFATQALNAMDAGKRVAELDLEPSGPLRIGAPVCTPPGSRTSGMEAGFTRNQYRRRKGEDIHREHLASIGTRL
jgi:DNA-binding transcriptional LysR family regulator